MYYIYLLFYFITLDMISLKICYYRISTNFDEAIYEPYCIDSDNIHSWVKCTEYSLSVCHC